jgi:hypothetical protein
MLGKVAQTSQMEEGNNITRSASMNVPSTLASGIFHNDHLRCACNNYDLNYSNTCKNINPKLYKTTSTKPTQCGKDLFRTGLCPPEGTSEYDMKSLFNSQLVSKLYYEKMTGIIGTMKGKYAKDCKNGDLIVRFSSCKSTEFLKVKKDDIVGDTDTSNLTIGDEVWVECRSNGCNNMIDANKHFFVFLLLVGNCKYSPNGSLQHLPETKLKIESFIKAKKTILQCFPKNLNIAKDPIKKFFSIPKGFWKPLFASKDELVKAVRLFFSSQMTTCAMKLIQNAMDGGVTTSTTYSNDVDVQNEGEFMSHLSETPSHSSSTISASTTCNISSSIASSNSSKVKNSFFKERKQQIN